MDEQAEAVERKAAGHSEGFSVMVWTLYCTCTNVNVMNGRRTICSRESSYLDPKASKSMTTQTQTSRPRFRTKSIIDSIGIVVYTSRGFAFIHVQTIQPCPFQYQRTSRQLRSPDLAVPFLAVAQPASSHQLHPTGGLKQLRHLWD